MRLKIDMSIGRMRVPRRYIQFRARAREAMLAVTRMGAGIVGLAN